MASTRTEAFSARVVDLGLEPCLAALKLKGLDTHAKFAFGSDYTPQHPDPAVLTESLLKPVAGENGEKFLPMLRMLWWESWGAATADLKRSAESSATSKRALGAPELGARRKAVEQLVSPGLEITPELDVSDSLITECVGLVDQNRLQYIPWEICTTRDLEVVGTKKDPSWVKDTDGFMKAEFKEGESRTKCTSQYALDHILMRRGLAMAMADLMSWNTHEKIRRDLMCAMNRLPPPGYDPVTLGQVRRADETLFRLLQRAVQNGVRGPKDALPLDAKDIVDKALLSREYNLELQPLQSVGGAKRKQEPNGEADSGDEAQLSRGQRKRKNKRDRQAEEIRDLKKQVAKGAGKDKGAQRGKGGGGRSPPLPWQLRQPGVAANTAEGEPVCFAFSLGSCKVAAPGDRCPKGLHVCALTKCGKPHSYMEYHKK